MKDWRISHWCAAGILLAAVFLTGSAGAAGDLEDGISTYTDESVSKDDEVFKNEKNIKYIITKAKSQAGKDKNAGGTADSSGSTTQEGGNMNSVLIGPGSQIKGDVIIIDESKGDKTLISR